MTENVNGIQVDVSKYVGEEIARLAVASIDEDRLNRLAEKAIRDLYENQWFEGQRTTTIHRMAAQLLGEKIQKYVADILERDDFKEQARRQAEQIVEDMQQFKQQLIESLEALVDSSKTAQEGWLQNSFDRLVGTYTALKTSSMYRSIIFFVIFQILLVFGLVFYKKLDNQLRMFL